MYYGDDRTKQHIMEIKVMKFMREIKNRTTPVMEIKERKTSHEIY